MHLLRILPLFVLTPALILAAPLPQGEGSTACAEAIDGLDQAINTLEADNAVCITMSLLLLGPFMPTVALAHNFLGLLYTLAGNSSLTSLDLNV